MEGFAPDPTGITHHVELTYDQWQQWMNLMKQLDQHQRWGNDHRCEELREQLRLQPWWPRGHQPGDHIAVRVKPRPMVLVRVPLRH